MGKIALILFLVVVGIAAAGNLTGNLLLRSVSARLSRHLTEQNYTAFEQLLEGWLAKSVIRPSNRCLLKLNEAIARRDDDQIDAVLAVFEKMGMNRLEQRTVYTNLFYYYIDRDDTDKATRYYRLLSGLPGYRSYGTDRLYNTLVLKKDSYLESTLEELERASVQDRPALESLISIMYCNRGDENKYREYQDLSERHMERLLEEDRLREKC